MARKNDKQMLEDLQNKIAELEAKKKEVQARYNEKERKARTRRFCVLGGDIEKLLGRKLTDEDISKTIAFLRTQEARGKFYSKALEKDDEYEK